MARHLKLGLDYFPLDVDFESDPKIRKLFRTFGSEAVLIYIDFLCIVYKNGYYVESDLESLAEDIWYHLKFKSVDFKFDDLMAILNKMVDMNMIDFVMLQKNIITSKAIQKQFMASTIRRKNSDRTYWILTEDDEKAVSIYADRNRINAYKNNDEESDVEEDIENINVRNNEINVRINEENDRNNEVSDRISTQSKSKRKVKEKKKEDREDKYDKRNVPFSLCYYTKCLIDDHLITIYDVDLYKFEELFEGARQAYDFELIQKVFRYTRDYVRKHKDEIESVYDYFKFAFEKNLNQMDGYEERLANFARNFKEMVENLKMKNDE